MRHAGAEFGCGWVPAVEEGWGDMPEGVGVQGDTSVRNCVVWPETHGREAGGASSGRGLIWAGHAGSRGQHCDFSSSWPELLGRPPASAPALLHS